jgi:hypothetical protein
MAKKYDRIGFVYPTYFWGLPKRVIEFAKGINLESNKDAYYYAITTYGGSAGNAVYQLYELLCDRHTEVQFCSRLSNFIAPKNSSCVKLYVPLTCSRAAAYGVAYDMIYKLVGTLSVMEIRRLAAGRRWK